MYPQYAPDKPIQNIRDKQLRLLGTVHKANGVWYAQPRWSQITMIPCESLADACDTVERMGVPARS